MTEGRDEQELDRGIDVSLEDGSSIDGFLPEIQQSWSQRGPQSFRAQLLCY